MKAVMPDARTYDAEIECWPWTDLLVQCAKLICEKLPKDAILLDYMCGTGLLLERIRRRRKDLHLVGCDASRAYLRHAKAKSGTVEYYVGDALQWSPSFEPNAISVTAGIHHLTPVDQRRFVRKAAAELPKGGLFIVGEEVLPPYRARIDRLTAITRLYSVVLPEICRRKPTTGVMQASLDVMMNDIFQRGEYKVDLPRLFDLISSRFEIIGVSHTWPSKKAGFGDVIIIGRKA